MKYCCPYCQKMNVVDKEKLLLGKITCNSCGKYFELLEETRILEPINRDNLQIHKKQSNRGARKTKKTSKDKKNFPNLEFKTKSTIFIAILISFIIYLIYQNYWQKKEFQASLEKAQRINKHFQREIDVLTEKMAYFQRKKNSHIKKKDKNRKTHQKFPRMVEQKDLREALYPNKKGELHIIGVYEGNYPTGVRHSGGYHPQGNVKVFVHITDQPIVLVLCSYEPVKWEISLKKEVKIKEIILGGYYKQEVMGIPSNVPIHKSYFFAYTMDDQYHKALRKIKKITALEISSFQGKYSGSSFVLDSNIRKGFQDK